jgi:hypothetical protein
MLVATCSGAPDAGNLHVRCDEGGEPDGRLPATLPFHSSSSMPRPFLIKQSKSLCKGTREIDGGVDSTLSKRPSGSGAALLVNVQYAS